MTTGELIASVRRRITRRRLVWERSARSIEFTFPYARVPVSWTEFRDWHGIGRDIEEYGGRARVVNSVPALPVRPRL